MDGVVRDLAAAALPGLETRWAVLALGGWGAHRLLPHSDLDLLIVTEEPLERLKPAVSRLLYPLWDAGLTVGHQVRSPRDHVRLSRADVQVLTSTLTGRHLCGDAGLSHAVLDATARAAHRGRRALLREMADRPTPGSPYRIEPDLKNGAGGQRDLDEITWTGSVLTGVPAADTGAALSAGLIDPEEASALAMAMGSITAARWALQAASSRATELLTLEMGADTGQDLESLHGAMGTVHHTLRRVRARAAGRHTRFDPRAGSVRALDPQELDVLLREGIDATDDVEEAAWAGLLDDLVPSFSALMNARRPALSHVHTVGTHSVRTALLMTDPATLLAVHSQTSLPSNGRTLRIAGLLHDLGKAQRGPGHAERGAAVVPILAPRLQLSEQETEEVSLLVREHLLLAETAATADIQDPGVIAGVVDRLGSPRMLEELHRLTVADSLATGPGAWTDWHGALVGELVSRARGAFDPGQERMDPRHRTMSTRSAAMRIASGTPAAQAVGSFLPIAPLSYFACVSPVAAVRHATLVDDLARNRLPDKLSVSVTPAATPGAWEVAVVGHDRPGLFAAACGALSLSGLDILAADAHELDGGTVLDVFVVRSDTGSVPDTAKWSALERHLTSAVRDPLALHVRLEERRRHYPRSAERMPHVSFGEASDHTTEVFVWASDRIGLLYDVARAIADCGLRIAWARAITRSGVARDTFRVVDAQGGPVTDPGVLGHVAMRIRERL